MKTIGGKNGARQYALQSVIGQGSFGKVYYSPPYAIKEVTLNVQPFVKQAIKNETGILRQLNHPNIVRLVEIIEEGSSLFMVMEYCEQDLSQFLRKFKLDEGRAIQIIKQVAMGLNCLVERGVIHRDLKPANILVNSRNEFKLADFGLARYVQEFDSSLLQTIAGTPLYMAPQILRKSPYTTKCDIWSAGVIFYELLTGRIPWTASNQRELYTNITSKPLSIPSNLSEWSKTLLSRMLVVSENDRIGWEELFEHIKSQPRPRSRAKERPNSSAAKSQTNFANLSPLKNQKETVAYPSSKLKLAVGYGRLDSLKDRQRPVLQALSRITGKDPRSPCPLRLSTPRMVQEIASFSQITAIVILDFIVFTLLFVPNQDLIQKSKTAIVNRTNFILMKDQEKQPQQSQSQSTIKDQSTLPEKDYMDAINSNNRLTQGEKAMLRALDRLLQPIRRQTEQMVEANLQVQQGLRRIFDRIKKQRQEKIAYLNSLRQQGTQTDPFIFPTPEEIPTLKEVSQIVVASIRNSAQRSTIKLTPERSSQRQRSRQKRPRTALNKQKSKPDRK